MSEPPPQKPKRETLAQRIADLDTRLRDARAGILDFLTWQSRHDIRSLKVPLFAMVCDAIYEAAKEFHKDEEEWGTHDFPFYLWPGYNSLVADLDGKKRVDIRVPIEWEKENGGTEDTLEPIECGISPVYHVGALQKIQSHENDEILVADIRNILIKRGQGFGDDYPEDVRTDISNDKNRRQLLHHGLIEANSHADNLGFRILGNPCAQNSHGDRLHPLRGLVVRHCQQGEKCGQIPPSVSDAQGLLEVWIPQNLDPEQWGPRVAEEISTKLSSTKGLWPKLQKASDNDEADRKTAIQLYSLWLQAVFHNPKNTGAITLPTSDAEAEPIKAFEPLGRKYFEWLEHFQMRYPELADFVRKFSSYNYWYSLSVDAAAGETGSDESLGSMMLFSSRRLDPHFLVNVRQWTENIYMFLREVESTKQAEKSGALKGYETTLNAWSHELSSELRRIKGRLRDPQGDRVMLDWLLDQSNPAPFYIAYPKPLIDAKLSYLGNWLHKNAGMPTRAKTLEDLIRHAYDSSRQIAATLHHRDAYVTSCKGLSEMETMIDKDQSWLNRICSLEVNANFSLVIEIDSSTANEYAISFSRIFYAAFFNATKHLFLQRESLKNPLLKVSIESGKEAVNLSFVNTTNREELNPKESGTKATLLALLRTFNVGEGNLNFQSFKENGDLFWLTRISFPLRTQTNNKSAPWIILG